MNRLILALVVLGLIHVSFKNATSETYTASVEESTITWAASRPGKTHEGTLSISEGNFVFDDDQLAGGEFVIDMNTIKVTDIEPGKMNDKLVNHLRSADFFDVENHTTGTYKILGSEVKDGKILVKGQLTLKGISNEVEFLADVSNDGNTVTLKANEFKIDRTKWDIKFRSGKFFDNLKNKLIYDDIVISVIVKATK
ncbi:MAG: YceI family protein [Flavobacteriaceae bacterium]|nr:YceI family protein [Flavobacteriaceae bacterium]